MTNRRGKSESAPASTGRRATAEGPPKRRRSPDRTRSPWLGATRSTLGRIPRPLPPQLLAEVDLARNIAVARWGVVDPIHDELDAVAFSAPDVVDPRSGLLVRHGEYNLEAERTTAIEARLLHLCLAALRGDDDAFALITERLVTGKIRGHGPAFDPRTPELWG